MNWVQINIQVNEDFRYMKIHIFSSLVVNYPGFVLVRVNLKEDNFLVLQVVYETENSKLIMILRSQG